MPVATREQAVTVELGRCDEDRVVQAMARVAILDILQERARAQRDLQIHNLNPIRELRRDSIGKRAGSGSAQCVRILRGRDQRNSN